MAKCRACGLNQVTDWTTEAALGWLAMPLEDTRSGILLPRFTEHAASASSDAELRGRALLLSRARCGAMLLSAAIWSCPQQARRVLRLLMDRLTGASENDPDSGAPSAADTVRSARSPLWDVLHTVVGDMHRVLVTAERLRTLAQQQQLLQQLQQAASGELEHYSAEQASACLLPSAGGAAADGYLDGGYAAAAVPTSRDGGAGPHSPPDDRLDMPLSSEADAAAFEHMLCQAHELLPLLCEHATYLKGRCMQPAASARLARLLAPLMPYSEGLAEELLTAAGLEAAEAEALNAAAAEAAVVDAALQPDTAAPAVDALLQAGYMTPRSLHARRGGGGDGATPSERSQSLGTAAGRTPALRPGSVSAWTSPWVASMRSTGLWRGSGQDGELGRTQTDGSSASFTSWVWHRRRESPDGAEDDTAGSAAPDGTSAPSRTALEPGAAEDLDTALEVLCGMLQHCPTLPPALEGAAAQLVYSMLDLAIRDAWQPGPQRLAASCGGAAGSSCGRILGQAQLAVHGGWAKAGPGSDGDVRGPIQKLSPGQLWARGLAAALRLCLAGEVAGGSCGDRVAVPFGGGAAGGADLGEGGGPFHLGPGPNARAGGAMAMKAHATEEAKAAAGAGMRVMGSLAGCLRWTAASGRRRRPGARGSCPPGTDVQLRVLPAGLLMRHLHQAVQPSEGTYASVAALERPGSLEHDVVSAMAQVFAAAVMPSTAAAGAPAPGAREAAVGSPAPLSPSHATQAAAAAGPGGAGAAAPVEGPVLADASGAALMETCNKRVGKVAAATLLRLRMQIIAATLEVLLLDPRRGLALLRAAAPTLLGSKPPQPAASMQASGGPSSPGSSIRPSSGQAAGSATPGSPTAATLPTEAGSGGGAACRLSSASQPDGGGAVSGPRRDVGCGGNGWPGHALPDMAAACEALCAALRLASSSLPGLASEARAASAAPRRSSRDPRHGAQLARQERAAAVAHGAAVAALLSYHSALQAELDELLLPPRSQEAVGEGASSAEAAAAVAGGERPGVALPIDNAQSVGGIITGPAADTLRSASQISGRGLGATGGAATPAPHAQAAGAQLPVPAAADRRAHAPRVDTWSVGAGACVRLLRLLLGRLQESERPAGGAADGPERLRHLRLLCYGLGRMRSSLAHNAPKADGPGGSAAVLSAAHVELAVQAVADAAALCEELEPSAAAGAEALVDSGLGLPSPRRHEPPPEQALSSVATAAVRVKQEGASSSLPRELAQLNTALVAFTGAAAGGPRPRKRRTSEWPPTAPAPAQRRPPKAQAQPDGQGAVLGASSTGADPRVAAGSESHGPGEGCPHVHLQSATEPTAPGVANRALVAAGPPLANGGSVAAAAARRRVAVEEAVAVSQARAAALRVALDLARMAAMAPVAETAAAVGSLGPEPGGSARRPADLIGICSPRHPGDPLSVSDVVGAACSLLPPPRQGPLAHCLAAQHAGGPSAVDGSRNPPSPSARPAAATDHTGQAAWPSSNSHSGSALLHMLARALFPDAFFTLSGASTSASCSDRLKAVLRAGLLAAQPDMGGSVWAATRRLAADRPLAAAALLALRRAQDVLEAGPALPAACHAGLPHDGLPREQRASGGWARVSIGRGSAAAVRGPGVGWTGCGRAPQVKREAAAEAGRTGPVVAWAEHCGGTEEAGARTVLQARADQVAHLVKLAAVFLREHEVEDGRRRNQEQRLEREGLGRGVQAGGGEAGTAASGKVAAVAARRAPLGACSLTELARALCGQMLSDSTAATGATAAHAAAAGSSDRGSSGARVLGASAQAARELVALACRGSSAGEVLELAAPLLSADRGHPHHGTQPHLQRAAAGRRAPAWFVTCPPRTACYALLALAGAVQPTLAAAVRAAQAGSHADAATVASRRGEGAGAASGLGAATRSLAALQLPDAVSVSLACSLRASAEALAAAPLPGQLAKAEGAHAATGHPAAAALDAQAGGAMPRCVLRAEACEERNAAMAVAAQYLGLALQCASVCADELMRRARCGTAQRPAAPRDDDINGIPQRCTSAATFATAATAAVTAVGGSPQRCATAAAGATALQEATSGARPHSSHGAHTAPAPCAPAGGGASRARAGGAAAQWESAALADVVAQCRYYAADLAAFQKQLLVASCGSPGLLRRSAAVVTDVDCFLAAYLRLEATLGLASSAGAEHGAQPPPRVGSPRRRSGASQAGRRRKAGAAACSSRPSLAPSTQGVTDLTLNDAATGAATATTAGAAGATEGAAVDGGGTAVAEYLARVVRAALERVWAGAPAQAEQARSPSPPPVASQQLEASDGGGEGGMRMAVAERAAAVALAGMAGAGVPVEVAQDHAGPGQLDLEPARAAAAADPEDEIPHEPLCVLLGHLDDFDELKIDKSVGRTAGPCEFFVRRGQGGAPLGGQVGGQGAGGAGAAGPAVHAVQGAGAAVGGVARAGGGKRVSWAEQPARSGASLLASATRSELQELQEMAEREQACMTGRRRAVPTEAEDGEDNTAATRRAAEGAAVADSGCGAQHGGLLPRSAKRRQPGSAAADAGAGEAGGPAAATAPAQLPAPHVVVAGPGRPAGAGSMHGVLGGGAGAAAEAGGQAAGAAPTTGGPSRRRICPVPVAPPSVASTLQPHAVGGGGEGGFGAGAAASGQTVGAAPSSAKPSRRICPVPVAPPAAAAPPFGAAAPAPMPGMTGLSSLAAAAAAAGRAAAQAPAQPAPWHAFARASQSALAPRSPQLAAAARRAAPSPSVPVAGLSAAGPIGRGAQQSAAAAGGAVPHGAAAQSTAAHADDSEAVGVRTRGRGRASAAAGAAGGAATLARGGRHGANAGGGAPGQGPEEARSAAEAGEEGGGGRKPKRRRKGAQAQLPRNAYLAACVQETRGRDSGSEDGWSELEDFIVCQPDRNYGQLFNVRFGYGPKDDEEDD